MGDEGESGGSETGDGEREILFAKGGEGSFVVAGRTKCI